MKIRQHEYFLVFSKDEIVFYYLQEDPRIETPEDGGPTQNVTEGADGSSTDDGLSTQMVR